MQKPTYNQLLDAGVHFGHLRKKWNPKMRPYIFKEHKGVHLIDLNRTSECLDRAALALKQIAKSGKKIMFVATKKQARVIVAEAAKSVNMPYVTDRWLGGMMTNFTTIRRSVKKMNNIDRMLSDGNVTNITKKERLTLSREKGKMERVLSGVANLNRLPSAIFVIDILHEHLAIEEAEKLGIRTFAMVDTNSDPNKEYIIQAIKEGLSERSEEVKDSE